MKFIFLSDFQRFVQWGLTWEPQSRQCTSFVISSILYLVLGVSLGMHVIPQVRSLASCMGVFLHYCQIILNLENFHEDSSTSLANTVISFSSCPHTRSLEVGIRTYSSKDLNITECCRSYKHTLQNFLNIPQHISHICHDNIGHLEWLFYFADQIWSWDARFCA